MNNIQKRILLFLGGCMTVRFIIAYIAKNINTEYLPYLATLAIMPILGWLYIIFIGKRDVGIETFGDKIWWKNLRIVHVIIYGLFVYLAYNKNKESWKLLLIDVLLGFSFWLMHHMNEYVKLIDNAKYINY